MLYRFTPVKAREAIEHFGSAEQAWAQLHEENMTSIMERACRELDFIAKHDIHLYSQDSEGYPYRLWECPDAPILLYGKGNQNLNRGHMVSIVGTRRASEHGRDMTTRLVRELAKAVPDVTIISGLAYGIDVAAHRAALAADVPTLIVPAHGLDRIYPTVHRPVAVEALKQGGIVTEYPSGTEPEKMNFVARNRIVAGMADAVVVIESSERGGSLITAGLALDYNREVFAMPGRPDDELSRGCNMLIRHNRAMLLTSADELVEYMGWQRATTPIQTELLDLTMNLSELGRKIVEKLRSAEDGLHVNQLSDALQVSYSELSAELTLLELEEVVRALPGGVYRAVK